MEDELTDGELFFLSNEFPDTQKNAVQWQVEALWALAWAVGCHDTLDFADSCANDFVSLLPDLKKGEAAEPFLTTLKKRNLEKFIEECDLAYCLHWGAREAMLSGKIIYGAVPSEVVLERRRALEWLVSDQAWDEVSLDT